MKSTFLSAIVTALCLMIIATHSTTEAKAKDTKGIQAVIGLWKTHDGGLVRFFSCGSQLCGKLVRTSTGQKKDKNNSNPKMRNRPIKGLTIIRSRKKSSPTKWHGTVYNFKDGQTYSGSLKLTAANKAEVTGCMAGGLCQSATWHKISKTRLAGN